MSAVQGKPFSQACENNKQAIFSVLDPRLARCRHVLEIGSGTGQHAVCFAAKLPQLIWQTSDLPEQHEGILQWLADYPGDNVRPPVALNVEQTQWPVKQVDAVFTANTFHIAAWSQVLSLLDGCARILPPGGPLIVYGPFNEEGAYTSDSNARFDQWLKQNAPHQGIRDREQVRAEALQRGLVLQETLPMPANNVCLVFERLPSESADRGES